MLFFPLLHLSLSDAPPYGVYICCSLESPVICSSGNEVLLLLRSSKHNNNTWGLPGGNVEHEDTNLLVTAKREAQEEMGSVPEAAYHNQILTK